MSGEVVSLAEGPATAPAVGLSAASTRRATTIMIAVRAGYAYNWYTVGPALPAIGAQFSVGPAEWGLLLAIFLVAAGVLQVPAGMLSQRFGSRAVALAGAALLGAASIASGFAPSFGTLVALRGAAGVGAALFFSPAIGLVGSLYPEGKRGVPIGMFSSAFSGGAAAGVLLSAIAVGPLGWHWTLALGGIGLLVLTLGAVALIPRGAGAALPASISRPKVPVALRLPALWAIGLAFIGLEGATFATGQFLVPYGTIELGWGAALAGAVGMAFILPSIVGGPIGGYVTERRTNRRTQFLVAGAVATVTVSLIPWVGLIPMVLLGIGFSFAYGATYAIMYVLPNYLPGLPRDEIPVGIGLFNSVQLAGGAIVAWAFGLWVASVGYPLAWSLLAIAVIVPLAFLVYLPRNGSGEFPHRDWPDPAGPVLRSEPDP